MNCKNCNTSLPKKDPKCPNCGTENIVEAEVYVELTNTDKAVEILKQAQL